MTKQLHHLPSDTVVKPLGELLKFPEVDRRIGQAEATILLTDAEYTDLHAAFLAGERVRINVDYYEYDGVIEQFNVSNTFFPERREVKVVIRVMKREGQS